MDEGHENFHNNFRLDLYAHVPLTVALSATMVPDDKFLQQMYQIVYPDSLRMDGGAYVKYVRMLNVPYSLDMSKDEPVYSWRGRGDYSQLAYEFWLLKDKNSDRLASVVDMLAYDTDNLFLPNRIDDHKLLLFFDSVEMCVHFESVFQDRYPNLKVGKYTSEEDVTVLNNLDIIIATTKSADTGVDIPRLQMVFNFVARRLDSG